MHLTGNELAVASSAVTALAIVGGYLGVRSANQNALKISREERSSRDEREFNTLKRTLYAKTLSELLALGTAQIEAGVVEKGKSVPSEAVRRRTELVSSATACVSELGLISGNDMLVDLAGEALLAANQSSNKEQQEVFGRTISKLEFVMRCDLEGKALSNDEDLDRLLDPAPTNKSSAEETASG